jgi:hypothetical protein
MATKKTAAKKTTKPAVEELEELDEAVESDGKSAKDEVIFGVADLAALLSENADKAVTTRELRTLIRKMARDGSGRVDREIKAGNRTRYSWSGPNDPEVKQIIEAFNAGELEADKQEKLAALKARKAEKKAAGEPTGKEAKKAKAVEVEEDDDELELDDDE